VDISEKLEVYEYKCPVCPLRRCKVYWFDSSPDIDASGEIWNLCLVESICRLNFYYCW